MTYAETREYPIIPADDPRFEQSAKCELATARLFDERSSEERSEAAYWRRVDVARGLCFACPVRVACLNHGLNNGLSGVMGGEMLTDGRIQLPKNRRQHTLVGV